MSCFSKGGKEERKRKKHHLLLLTTTTTSTFLPLSFQLTSRGRNLAPHDLDPHVVRRRRVLPGADLVPPPPVAGDALGHAPHPAHRRDAAVGDGRGGALPGHRVEAEAELAAEAVPSCCRRGSGSGGFFFPAASQHELPEGLGRELVVLLLLCWRRRRRR